RLERAYLLLHALVLLARLVDHALELRVAGGRHGGIEELLLEPRVHVQLLADLLDDAAPAPGVRLILEPLEELGDGLMVLLHQVEYVHAVPPRVSMRSTFRPRNPHASRPPERPRRRAPIAPLSGCSTSTGRRSRRPTPARVETVGAPSRAAGMAMAS